MSKINRKIKDSLFRKIFSEEYKDNVLSLYNALNNSNYTNLDDLEITNLDDVIYMRMKNDLSFLIKEELFLIEHQSTINPNMPLRSLLYFARLYENIIDQEDLPIYGSIKIPTPKSIVLYNGIEQNKSVEKLKLSSLFEKEDKDHEFEWTVSVYNINPGNNEELLLKCKPLFDYMYFINAIKDRLRKGFNKEMSIKDSIEDCIQNDILSDFLKKSRNEAYDMVLTEFDEEKVMAYLRKQAMDDEKINSIRNLAEFCLEMNVSKEICFQKISEKYSDIDSSIRNKIIEQVYS